jgi:hypothetical protein
MVCMNPNIFQNIPMPSCALNTSSLIFIMYVMHLAYNLKCWLVLKTTIILLDFDEILLIVVPHKLKFCGE